MKPNRLLQSFVVLVTTAALATGHGALPAAAAGADITSLRLLNQTVSVSLENADVAVQLRASAPEALRNASIRATCTTCPTSTLPLESGSAGHIVTTSTDAVGIASLDVAQSTPDSTWVVDQVSFDDGGTPVVLDDAALTSRGSSPAARTFTVSRAASGDAPTAPRIGLSPADIDVTTANSEVVLEVDVVDAVPGVEFVDVTLADGLGGDKTTRLWAPDDLVAGSPRNGTLRATMPFGWNDVGTWTIAQVDLTDRYGDKATLTTLPAGASWGQVTVSRTSDNLAPAMATGPVLSPSTVNATTTDAQASLSIQITDDVSGFDRGWIGLVHETNPSRQITGWVSAADKISGTSRDGQYVVELTVPVRQLQGTYTATSLSVEDRAGNARDVTLSPALSLSVTTASDSTAPVLESLNLPITTTNLGTDLSSSGKRVTLFATISDDTSGPGHGLSAFSDSTYTYTDPDGNAATFPFGSAQRVSGNATLGTYALPIDLERAGVHTLTGLKLVDQDGHVTTVTSTGLAAANGTQTPTITAVRQGDMVAPSVTSLIAPTSSFVSSSDGQDFTLEVDVQDAGSSGSRPSGVKFVSALFTSPNGQSSIWADNYCTFDEDLCVVSGSDEGGRLKLSGWLPSYAAEGSWTLTSLDVSDHSGNYREYVGNDLGLVAGTKTLTVTGKGDATVPALTALSFTPDPVDARSGDWTAVAVNASASDDQSGLESVQIDFASPNGSQWATVSLIGGPDREWRPQELSATLAGTTLLPRNAAAGVWSATAFLLDNAGNYVELDATELAAGSLDGTLAVQGAQDTAPPVLESLAVSETAVDSTTQNRFVLVTARLSDAGSGVSDYPRYLDMGSSWRDRVYLSRVGGSNADGWYAGVWEVEQYAVPGARPITLRLSDEQGNEDTVTAAELSTRSLPSAIQVTSLGSSAPDGVIAGTVTGPSGAVSGAYVSACGPTDCGWDTTASDGSYEITGLPDGDYDVDVYPPSTSLNNGSATLTDLYSRSGHRATVNVALTAPEPLPEGSGTAVNGQTSGIPSVVYDESFTLTTQGCAGGTATYTVTQGGVTLRSGGMTEGPAGRYTTTVLPLQSPGSSTVTISINCPGDLPDSTLDFSLYIDPSGFVYDHDGTTTVPGATVTLYRSDTENGTYTQVPDGDAIMSPSNRTNPDTTDSTGHYGWLTIAGWYRVDVTKSHCYQPGSYDPASNTVDPVTESRLVVVPPEVTDLHVTIDCRNIRPVVSAARNGSGNVAPGTAVPFAASASDANGSDAALTFAWDFGDGRTGSGKTPSHTYSAAGTYTPRVTVTDDQGGTTTVTLASVSVVATAAAAPPPAQPTLSAADTTAPTVTTTKPAATTLGASTTVAWSGSDAVGVKSYDVRYRSAAWNKALGAYISPPAWQGTAAASVVQSMAAGTTYCFSVRARDAAGNVSAWSAERCTARPLDDRSLTSAGAWAKTKGKAFYSGTIATAKTKGASLTRAGALPGRVALVASKGKAYGTVGVFYNGKLVSKVNLAATRPVTKAVIPLPKLTKKGTIQLKVLTSGKTVQVDGLVTGRS